MPCFSFKKKVSNLKKKKTLFTLYLTIKHSSNGIKIWISKITVSIIRNLNKFIIKYLNDSVWEGVSKLYESPCQYNIYISYTRVVDMCSRQVQSGWREKWKSRFDTLSRRCQWMDRGQVWQEGGGSQSQFEYNNIII
jgi:hypothetical protein